MPKIILLLLIGGVLMPLLSYALVVVTNSGLKWSQVATSKHIGEWIWNLLGHLPIVLAISISLEPIFTFRTYVANHYGMITEYLFLIACIVPYALLLKHTFKLNEENIEVKALSSPISHILALLWTWLAIFLFLSFDDLLDLFVNVAQLILFFA
jgi:hypothetical protein